MSASDLQAEQWQSEMLAQLRGVSNTSASGRPGQGDDPPVTSCRVEGVRDEASASVGEPGRERADSAYRPAPHITAMSRRPRALHRAVSRRPATSGVGRVVSLAKTLVAGDSALNVHAEALVRLQTPVPTGRRVVVTAAHGGAGASTVTLLLADAFHAYRPDGVVLLDASGNAGGLLSRLPHAPTMSVLGANKHLDAGDVGAVLNPHQRPAWAALTPAADIRVTEKVAARLQRRVGVSVIDAGVYEPVMASISAAHDDKIGAGKAAPSVLVTGSDAVVVVCENTVRGLVCVDAAVRAVLAAGCARSGIVVVIVERVVDSGISLDQARREVQSSHGVIVADLPRDRHLAGGAHVQLHLVAPRTRHAVAMLAADAIEASVAPR